MNAEAELIPERTQIRWRLVPPFLAAAAILFVLFIIVGLYSERVIDVDNIGMPYWAVVRDAYSGGLAGLLLFGVPSLGALAMIWAAFARPQWSDKSLWSAAMILSTTQLAMGARLLFSRHEPPGWAAHPYPNLPAAIGMIAYGSWFMASATLRPLPKRIVKALCALAVLFCLSLPVANSYVAPVDIVGATLFAAACLCVGIFVAQSCGVDLFSRGDAGTAHRKGAPG